MDLKKRYQEKGSDLILMAGKTEEVMEGLVKGLKEQDGNVRIEGVWMQKEVSLGNDAFLLVMQLHDILIILLTLLIYPTMLPSLPFPPPGRNRRSPHDQKHSFSLIKPFRSTQLDRFKNNDGS